MAFTKIEPQPAARTDDLAWDEAGPGLYPNETAFDLGDGLLVAIDVQAVWQANGDVALAGNARWINPDGETHLTGDGTHVETDLPANATPGFIDAFGVEALQRHVALALLGEPVPLGGFVWSDAVLASVDIRKAVARVAQATPADLSSLLGLA